MKILTYEYSDPTGNTNWNFEKVELQNINLFVGNSGMGKTRLLNTIFNLFSQIHRKTVVPGNWKISLDIESVIYNWELEVAQENDNKATILHEKIEKVVGDNISVEIVNRNSEDFLFKTESLPKLSKNESAVSILQEESEINPLYTGLGRVLRRRFFQSELFDKYTYQGFPLGVLDKLAQANTIYELYPRLHSDINLHAILYILHKQFKDVYEKICSLYKQIFPFVEQILLADIHQIDPKIIMPGQAPIFCVKERSVKKLISLSELSSGMQKVLLILVDIYTLPPGSIYLIDEYENSLGVNAINFFPDLLVEETFDIQFLITSHHPYIINKFPVENWYVFHRTGSNVKILSGEKLKHRIGSSKQQAFIKLLNDPFFLEGRE